MLTTTIAISIRLSLPYLSISPTHEATYPPPILKAQAALADNFTIHHPNTGHWPFEQSPKEISEVVIEWAQKQSISETTTTTTVTEVAAAGE